MLLSRFQRRFIPAFFEEADGGKIPIIVLDYVDLGDLISVVFVDHELILIRRAARLCDVFTVDLSDEGVRATLLRELGRATNLSEFDNSRFTPPSWHEQSMVFGVRTRAFQLGDGRHGIVFHGSARLHDLSQRWVQAEKPSADNEYTRQKRQRTWKNRKEMEKNLRFVPGIEAAENAEAALGMAYDRWGPP